MEMPTERQITEAIVESKLRGETEAELMERIDAMCRLSDEDLARMGIHPARPEPVPSPSKGASKGLVLGGKGNTKGNDPPFW